MIFPSEPDDRPGLCATVSHSPRSSVRLPPTPARRLEQAWANRPVNLVVKNGGCSINPSETASSSPLLLEKRASGILVSQAGASIAYDNARDVPFDANHWADDAARGNCISIPDRAACIAQGVCLLRHFLWGWEGVAHASDALRWGRRIVERQRAHQNPPSSSLARPS